MLGGDRRWEDTASYTMGGLMTWSRRFMIALVAIASICFFRATSGGAAYAAEDCPNAPDPAPAPTDDDGTTTGGDTTTDQDEVTLGVPSIGDLA